MVIFLAGPTGLLDLQRIVHMRCTENTPAQMSFQLICIGIVVALTTMVAHLTSPEPLDRARHDAEASVLGASHGKTHAILQESSNRSHMESVPAQP